MPRFITEIKRTHTCGELTKADIGKEVVLFGWVNNRRDHGGAVFIDLRDRDGITQVVFEQDVRPEVHELAEELRLEYCVGHPRQGRLARRQREPEAPHRRDRGPRHRARDLQPLRADALPDRGPDRHRRGEAAPVPLPRPAPRAAPEDPDDARTGEPPHSQLLHRQRLPRARDAVHGQVHARRRAQLPRPVAASTPASSTRSPRAPSSSSSCTWSRASTGTSRSSAASATRTSASTGSPSSPRSTSR